MRRPTVHAVHTIEAQPTAFLAGQTLRSAAVIVEVTFELGEHAQALADLGRAVESVHAQIAAAAGVVAPGEVPA